MSQTNPQWHEILSHALGDLEPSYLHDILSSQDWLPGRERMFAAFHQPLTKVRYILLGESPYPRSDSANGHAFWDNAVHDLWSSNGLSKAVNRATSLRNFMKMLLLARGDLSHDFSPRAIAALDKTRYWQTGEQFFSAMINQGFVLLNASLVYRKNKVNIDAAHWRPFLNSVLNQLAQQKPDVGLIRKNCGKNRSNSAPN